MFFYFNSYKWKHFLIELIACFIFKQILGEKCITSMFFFLQFDDNRKSSICNKNQNKLKTFYIIRHLKENNYNQTMINVH